MNYVIRIICNETKYYYAKPGSYGSVLWTKTKKLASHFDNLNVVRAEVLHQLQIANSSYSGSLIEAETNKIFCYKPECFDVLKTCTFVKLVPKDKPYTITINEPITKPETVFIPYNYPADLEPKPMKVIFCSEGESTCGSSK